MSPQQVLENAGTAIGSRILHRIFEARAEARPDAVAVVFGNRAITCGELDARGSLWHHRVCDVQGRNKGRPGSSHQIRGASIQPVRRSLGPVARMTPR